jgi:lysophospholipase L1-like esterase
MKIRGSFERSIKKGSKKNLLKRYKSVANPLFSEEGRDIKTTCLNMKCFFWIVFCAWAFTLMCETVRAEDSITIISPENNANIQPGSNFTFNISLYNNISYVNLFLSNFLLKKFNKGDFDEIAIGNTKSVNYLNEYNVSINPTIVSSGDAYACGEISAACNLLNTTLGNVVGGYAILNTVTSNYFLVTLNDSYYVQNVSISPHASQGCYNMTFYSSLDNINFNQFYTGNIGTSLFTTPLNSNARYIKLKCDESLSSAKYFNYINITGMDIVGDANFSTLTFPIPINLLNSSQSYYIEAIDKNSDKISSKNYFTLGSNPINYTSNTTPSDYSGSSSYFAFVPTNFDYAIPFENSNNNEFSLITLDNSTIFGNMGIGAIDGLTATTEDCFSGYCRSTTLNQSFGENEYAFTHSLDLTSGFTIKFNFKFSEDANLTNFLYMLEGRTSKGGFLLQTTAFNRESDTFNMLFYLKNSTEGNNKVGETNSLNFTRGVWHSVVVSYNKATGIAYIYQNGALIGKTTSIPESFYNASSGQISIGNKFTNSNDTGMIYYDEIFLSNQTYSPEILQALSENTMKSSIEIRDNNQDKSFNFTFFIKSALKYTFLPIIENIQIQWKPLVSIFSTAEMLAYNDTVYLYCNASANNSIMSGFQIFYDDGTIFENLVLNINNATNTSFAVIGDSMYNDQTDVGGKLGTYMGISFSNMNIYAVAGHTCLQVYEQLVNNVTNGTTNLIVGCGVNGGIPTSNIEAWENIYNTAKDKNISNIYMSTMPPFGTINNYEDAIANETCERQKEQNEWLLNFAAIHSDFYVVDIWSDWHDTTGTNKTDCGWYPGTQYKLAGDEIHPSTEGYAYWAEKIWNESFNRLINGSFSVNLTNTYLSNTTINFSCLNTYEERTSDTSYYSVLFYINETLCTSSGKYWYDNSCHHTAQSTPPTPSTPSGSISSSPSGTQATIFYPTESNLVEGYSKSLGENWKLIFNIKNETHQLNIDNIIRDSVIITIKSEPLTFNLSIGETKQVDLDNDGVYDISVLLINITESSSSLKAEIMIKVVDEVIKIDGTIKEDPANDDNTQINEETIPAKQRKTLWTYDLIKSNWYYIVGAIIFLGIFISIIFRSIRRKHKKVSIMEYKIVS